jgi:hypothetical protein
VAVEFLAAHHGLAHRLLPNPARPIYSQNRLAPRALVQRRQHPRPGALDPDLDNSALIGFPVAERLFDIDRSPTTIYVRAADDQVEQTRDLLAATANPEHPEEVEVSRPSDALAAEAAAKSAFNGLFLELGAVALLVGGVGLCPGGDWPPPLSHFS